MNYLKEAEQNIVNIAKDLTESIQFIRALRNIGLDLTHEYIGREKFFKGLELMSDGLYREYCYAIEQCFVFVGVGGEEVEKYAFEKFKERFDPEQRISVMEFLDKHGQRPSWYSADVEKQFRAEAEEFIRAKEAEK